MATELKLPEELAGLQKTDQPIPQPDRHGRVAHPDGACNGLWFLGCPFGEAFLHLQTGAAGAAFLGQNAAKWVFVAFAMVRQLPRFHRPQSNGQTGGFTEGAFVILVNSRVDQRFHQRPVAIAIAIATRSGIWVFGA